MVLLDGLEERGLAQQQEAEANPHGQQPGHGEAAGRRGDIRGNRNRALLQLIPKTHRLSLLWGAGTKDKYTHMSCDIL